MRAAKKGMESHLTDCNDIWRSKMQALLFFALFKGQMLAKAGLMKIVLIVVYVNFYFSDLPAKGFS